MIEIEAHKIYIKQEVRSTIFKVLQIINKWQKLFPELKEPIHNLMVKISLLNKKTGHTFCEIINGERVISVPNIEFLFINICDSFIKKGILIRPVNKKLHKDIEEIIDLTKDLSYCD